jgi:hypothetical protein
VRPYAVELEEILVNVVSASDRSPGSAPPDRPRGYLAAVLGALGGMWLGGLLTYLTAIQMEGDPSAGMANLGLAMLVIALVIIGAIVGGGIGCAGALRWRGHPGAIRTALILVPIQVVAVLIPPFGLLVFASPIFARYLALRWLGRTRR